MTSDSDNTAEQGEGVGEGDLPIHDVLPELVEDLRRERGAVLVAPTGAGKTTQVPQAILDAELVEPDQRILVLEPRRVAARATAKRIAEERGADLGGEVGYQVRFDRQMSDRTRIAVITEGILTRRLQSDVLLEGVGAVVLDEFHERSIHADLGIAFLKELQEVREDLLVTVMSATITAGPIADYLGVPTVESEGRTYPVDVEYLDQPSDDRVHKQVGRAVRRALRDEEDDGGDILVFLPGAGSIERTVDVLESMDVAEGMEVVPLYGALPPEEQDRAIEPASHRKIIVSTNIAETSLTIEGVTTVVDSGLVKQLEMDPTSGLDRLETTHVSMASADQRKGRAGRTRPGRAYRLWTRAFEHRMDDEQTPAIQRVDVTGPVLEVVAWSGDDPREFDWFEAPPDYALDRAVELLDRLGAIDAETFRVTDIGEALLDLPAHPRIGRMLLEGQRRGCARRVAGMAAVLAERDFVLSTDRDAPPGTCDLQRRVEVLEAAASGRDREASRLGMDVHTGRARQVSKVRGQLLGALDGDAHGESTGERGGDVDAEARKSLAMGFPDRICLSRGSGRNYVMTGGEPVALAWESVVEEAEVLVAPTIAGETRDRQGGVDSRALVRKAAELEREWLDELFGDRLDERVDVAFDDDRERVTARRRRTFDELTLDEAVVSVDDHASTGDVTRLLVDRALDDLEGAFDLGEHETQFLKRIASLREWRPELDLPRVPVDGDAGDDFREMLVQLCWGERSFDDLRRLDLVSGLKNYLTHEQLDALGRLVPPELEVPSGRTHRIHYEPGESPYVEVRIQEMFGAETGPRVVDGEIPVVLHLLAPNFRPAQITDDLPSFWDNTYPQVRKEMRSRYPKHPWPEDPRRADAVAM